MANLSEKTLLYVEDEPLSREILSHRFGRIFKQVLLANDGKEALAMLKNFTPDIIITDNLMPNLSGLEMAQMLRESGVLTPIILTTALNEKKHLEKAKDLGVALIQKPINIAELMAQIERLLSDDS